MIKPVEEAELWKEPQSVDYFDKNTNLLI